MAAGFFIMPNFLAVRLLPIFPKMPLWLRPALSRHIDLYDFMTNLLQLMHSMYEVQCHYLTCVFNAYW